MHLVPNVFFFSFFLTQLFIVGRNNICFLLHGVEISPLRGWEKRLIGKFSMLTPSCS